MHSLICIGELIVDFIPLDNSAGLAGPAGFKPAPGGAPANVAAGYSKLGGQAAVISKVGRDPFGAFLLEHLRAAGVYTGMILQTAEAQTGLAFVFKNREGENEFILYRNRSADMLLQVKELEIDPIRNSSILQFGSISLMGGPARESTLEAVRVAIEAGSVISFDPNLRPAAWPDLKQARQAILEGLALATILKASISELFFIANNRSGSIKLAVRALFENYPRLELIAVTKAEEGSFLCTRRQIIEVPPYTVDSLDPTGAGDSYMAALLFQIHHQLLQGNNTKLDWNRPDHFWKDLGRFANIAGALTTENYGAMSAMPDYQKIADANWE